MFEDLLKFLGISPKNKEIQEKDANIPAVDFVVAEPVYPTKELKQEPFYQFHPESNLTLKEINALVKFYFSNNMGNVPESSFDSIPEALKKHFVKK